MSIDALNQKMEVLLDKFSSGEVSMQDAILEFEGLMKEYTTLKKMKDNSSIELLKKFLILSLQKIEKLKALEAEYNKNLEENLRLKKQLGLL